ncbi:MAG: Trm112 family protein [Acidimicrobiales bacterium]
MTISAKLLEILVCPIDKGSLLYVEEEQLLYNPRLHRKYAIVDDIPNMLIDESEVVDDAEHERIVALARP